MASAELSKMFPTPPSHEHPMQSPCGQLEGSNDAGGDLSSGSSGSQNGVKTEPGLNGCSPTYSQEDPNKVSFFFYFLLIRQIESVGTSSKFEFDIFVITTLNLNCF